MLLAPVFKCVIFIVAFIYFLSQACDENGEKWQVWPGKPSKRCPFWPGKPS